MIKIGIEKKFTFKNLRNVLLYINIIKIKSYYINIF